MTESINTVVIGAGVVGLAVARALAHSGREVIVLDPHDGIGQETSSRNSEVIHAGIYYARDSLKAQLCVAGKQSLYAYCEAKSIAHKRLGKLIVATEPGDEDRLRELGQRAAANGVDDLQWLDAAGVAAMEPEVRSVAALHSPSSGILDSHALMLALQADLEAAGSHVAFHSRLAGAVRTDRQIELIVRCGGEETNLIAQTIVNCAGLHASNVADIVHGPGYGGPRTRYARGNYFDYGGPSPFSHLVYPLPQPGGLGIHATLDLGGGLRFGPDVEWIDKLDYSVDPQRAAAFAAAIATYWPDVEPHRLVPAYAGIRPKLSGPGEAAADFSISRTDDGSHVLIDLLGIESPGLTSALAIGDHVAALVAR